MPECLCGHLEWCDKCSPKRDGDRARVPFAEYGRAISISASAIDLTPSERHALEVLAGRAGQS